jgi:hypothetical protein
MSMEIIKQLYDIGYLFDSIQDIDVTKRTFRRFAEVEMKYRDLKGIKPEDILTDIYQTSLCLSLRGAEGKGDFVELLKGIERLKGFIFSEKFQIEKAIVHASKAAYISRVIEQDSKSLEKYSDPIQIAEVSINQPSPTRLNKLKKSNPEAFFYWWKAEELVNKSST